MTQQELYIKRLQSIRDKLIDLQKDVDDVIQDAHVEALRRNLVDSALAVVEDRLETADTDNIFQCIHNSWDGFDGKETCGAGWLTCKGNTCPSFSPGSPR